ncbi:hypothetical protein Atai01_53890 [Amycolatopsis taiwanensis]|uniref:DUF3558 domain-containing protein n=1 Tax=Amycolatopsis taiwanensis TaxID=342230 RepID=A0A9W6R7B5_9PSEU|nr:hypothetical protein Atai01_53890 [Amycolatopsis taiwanensis]
MSLTFVAATLVATGCTNAMDGTASPSTTGAAGASSTKSGNADAFGTMEACQVLDQLLAGHGFDAGERISARNECHASKFDFATYSLALDSTQGLTEYRAQNPGATMTSINGRTAMQATPEEGMCEFALDVDQHARALATVTMARAKDATQACSNAQQYAEQLESLLPKAR